MTQDDKAAEALRQFGEEAVAYWADFEKGMAKLAKAIRELDGSEQVPER